MKKLTAIILSVIMLLGVCGCAKEVDKTPISSTPQSNPTAPSELPIQNESKEYISERTKELEIYTAANRKNSYITEDNRYILYANVVDDFKLYRYDKVEKKAKILFDENQKDFLHSIKIYNNEIYFVTRTEQDGEYPSLYKIDFEGKNLQRLVENVGDDYVLLEDVIYYTTMADPVTSEWFTMYKYNLKSKQNKLVYDHQCENLNYIDGKIYFVDYHFDGQSINSSSGVVKVLDIATDKIETIEIDLTLGFGVENLRYFNGKLYFLTAYKTGEKALLCYNLKTKEQSEIIRTDELNVDNDPIENIRMTSYLILDEKLIYFKVACKNETQWIKNTIVELKDGSIKKYYQNKETSCVMLYCNGNIVTFDVSNQPSSKIHNAEYLNVNIASTAA